MDIGKIEFGPREMREQRISFALGNVSMHNPDVTREMVEQQDDILTHGHVFTYRSDYNQCSVCNGTHGRDDHAEITRLRDEVKRLNALLDAHFPEERKR